MSVTNVASKKGQPFRAVVVGCGRIGSLYSEEAYISGVHSHAQAYVEHPRTELVGVSDIDSTRLKQATRTWKVEGGSDPVELCSRLKPNLISISTPDSSHYELAKSIIESSPPQALFVEKPLALNIQDCELLVELAERSGVVLAVNYSRRFSPAFQALQQELKQGLHGCPILVRVLYSKGLFHSGTHAIDLMRFWLGEPTEAKGYAVEWGPEGDETYSADLWFENGCRVRLEAIDDRVASVFEVDVITDQVRWSFWLGGTLWEFFELKNSPLYSGYKTYVSSKRAETDPLFTNPMAECLKHAVTNLVDHLEKAAPLMCTGKDGLAALYWAERIRGSI